VSTFPIPITTIFAGLLALMLVAISIRVTVLRVRKKISFFDGGDPEMGRSLRVQGNFIEYVPMAIILMGMLEWMGSRPWVIYSLGAALLIGRFAHAWGLYGEIFRLRVVGTSLTWVVLAACGLLALGAVA